MTRQLGAAIMTMTVAGHYRIPYEEAEVLKTTPEKEKEIFPVIKATVEKNGIHYREISKKAMRYLQFMW